MSVHEWLCRVWYIQLNREEAAHRVEPELGEGRVIELKVAFSDGDLADVGASLFFVSFPRHSVIVGVLERTQEE